MKVLAKYLPPTLKNSRYFASFKKYDYTDGLNFKSLLTEEEVMVTSKSFRSWITLNFLHKLISCPEFLRILDKKLFLRIFLN